MLLGRNYYSSIYDALASEARRLQENLRAWPTGAAEAEAIGAQIDKISRFMGTLGQDLTPRVLARLKHEAVDLFPDSSEFSQSKQSLIEKLKEMRGIVQTGEGETAKVNPGLTPNLRYMLFDTQQNSDLTQEDNAYKDVQRGIVTINGHNLCYLTQPEFEQKLQRSLGIDQGLDTAEPKQRALYNFIILNAQRLLVPFMEDISTSALYDGNNLHYADSGANSIDWQISPDGIYCVLSSEAKCLLTPESMLQVNNEGGIQLTEMQDSSQFSGAQSLISQKCRFELVVEAAEDTKEMRATLANPQYRVEHHKDIHYSPDHQQQVEEKLHQLLSELLALKHHPSEGFKEIATKVEAILTTNQHVMRKQVGGLIDFIFEKKNALNPENPDYVVLQQLQKYLDQLSELGRTQSTALLAAGFSLIRDAPYNKLNAALISARTNEYSANPDILDIRTLTELLPTDQLDALHQGINAQLSNINRDLKKLLRIKDDALLKNYDQNTKAIVDDLKKLKNDIKMLVNYMGKYLDNQKITVNEADITAMEQTRKQLQTLATQCEDKIQKFSQMPSKISASSSNIFVRLYHHVFGESGILAQIKRWLSPPIARPEPIKNKWRKMHFAEDSALPLAKKPKLEQAPVKKVSLDTENPVWVQTDQGKQELRLSLTFPADQPALKNARANTENLEGKWQFRSAEANYIADFGDKGITIEAALKHGPVGLKNKISVSIKCQEGKEHEALDLATKVFPALAKTVERHLNPPESRGPSTR